MRAGVLLALALWGLGAQAECAPDRVEFRAPQDKAARVAFTVEVADTDGERAQGLMNRDSLAASQGMLFVYDSPRQPRFWMKNTLIPLDMIFLSPQGEVLHVHPQAVPHDETPIDGGPGVQYVLEIAGGLAARLQLAEGDVMRWPGLGAEAAWPCD